MILRFSAERFSTSSLPQHPGVYAIRDTTGADFYVGATNDLRYRATRHKASFLSGKGTPPRLAEAVRRAGIEAFTFEVLEQWPAVDHYNLRHREAHWIDRLRPTLNLYWPLFVAPDVFYWKLPAEIVARETAARRARHAAARQNRLPEYFI